MNDKDFTEIELEGYVEAGTPQSEDDGFLDGACCVRCKSHIKHIFLTNYGPMGGDCYATLSGDNSTRSKVRHYTKEVHKRMEGMNQYNIENITVKYNDFGKRSYYSAMLYFFDHKGQRRGSSIFQVTDKIISMALISIIEANYDVKINVKF